MDRMERYEEEMKAAKAQADTMPEPERTAFLRSKLDEYDRKIRAGNAEVAGAHDWLDLIATCLKVSDEDTRRVEAADRITQNGMRRLSPSERLRVAAKMGQRLAGEINIRAVDDFVTFLKVTGESVQTNGGKLAGVLVSLFADKRESWEVGQEALHRAAMWARAGFNELQLSDGLTTALLLTDVPRVDPDELRLPFDCFAVRLPQGLIPFFVPDAGTSRQEWCELLWVARYSNKFGERIRLWVDWRGLTIAREYESDWSTVHDGGEELADEDDIALDACFRLLRNFLLWLADREGLKAHRPESVPKKLQEKRERSGETWPTSWVFGREVTLRPELRRAAVEMALGRSKRHAVDGWKVRARFAVRGHWKNQAHGPGRALRRRQWIAPFWKGPETGEAFAHIYRDPKVSE